MYFKLDQRQPKTKYRFTVAFNNGSELTSALKHMFKENKMFRDAAIKAGGEIVKEAFKDEANIVEYKDI